MRKLFFTCCVLLLGLGGMSAQESIYGVANRLGIGVGVGTEGIGIDLATSFSKYCSVRLGVNFMPDISIDDDFDVTAGTGSSSYVGSINAEASIKRTTIDLKADIYPFPDASSFFVTVGLSMGGKKVIKVNGHSDDFATAASTLNSYGIDIGDYRLPIDDNGDVSGDARVNSVRPYIGLGFGRLIPKKRVCARFEIGVQYEGKPKIYAADEDVLESLDSDTSDDISKVLDYMKWYPCIKFSIRGRIL